ncbi:uncharacterized protein PGTG_11423 [Puccinia graminis f. sp. tritici CRL 75-36-700-3]|uniref:Uncharacterized protein n=1 Tax=Puccinia graminis f. sp. tritici (strain CRL 75-36-700-3 / race SCCL) TaxID=418459 RepID=E3KLQ5_PUCGT|nr:uncharacterized protein PGTG_11423 [Puccinia graminis f. sp. tritici CRL 75-36-700-3]EFP85254.2 hypothetical protein PGTG_11423 [Puccinia graminis f. sp. tritici CRL 75-36-700-3]
MATSSLQRSVFYMWRITGDRQWQDRGWRMFTSWMEACATTFGFADLEQVNHWPPQLSDKQESFVLAETTEAHPFRIETPEKPFKSFWTGPDPDLDGLYDPPGMNRGERGFGTFLQQWSRVDLGKISETDLQAFKKVMGVHG